MKRHRVHRKALGFLVCAALTACAAQKPEKTQVVWQKLDGSPATREELQRAAAACETETRKSGAEGTGRFAHIEWSVHMLDCMKSKGYTRVEKSAP